MHRWGKEKEKRRPGDAVACRAALLLPRHAICHVTPVFGKYGLDKGERKS